jgi:hypothetical protein
MGKRCTSAQQVVKYNLIKIQANMAIRILSVSIAKNPHFFKNFFAENGGYLCNIFI